MTKKELESLIKENKVQTVQHANESFTIETIKKGIDRAKSYQIAQHAPRTKWETIRTLAQAHIIESNRKEYIIIKWLDTKNYTLYFINYELHEAIDKYNQQLLDNNYNEKMITTKEEFITLYESFKKELENEKPKDRLFIEFTQKQIDLAKESKSKYVIDCLTTDEELIFFDTLDELDKHMQEFDIDEETTNNFTNSDGININHIIDILWQLTDPVNLKDGESITLYDADAEKNVKITNENGKIVFSGLQQ